MKERCRVDIPRPRIYEHKVQGRVICSSDYLLVIYGDLVQARKLHTFAGHEVSIQTMSFSTVGQRLASGDVLRFVEIWNLTPARDQLRKATP